jgi:protein-disulfide isomerase
VSKKNRQRKYGSGEEAPTASSGTETTKFYWILGAVAVLGVGIVGYSVGAKALSPTVSEPIEMDGLDDPAELMQVARGVVKGDPAAPISIIEFADFQCPGCGGFATQVKPLLDAEFVDTGKAKFVYYDFPLVSMHVHAFLAARAGHCAEDQDKFWPYHDMLYRSQSRWSTVQNPAGFFEDYAEDLGLDEDEFSACLKSDRHADVVTANMQLGYQLQIQGTPTIMVTQGQGVGRRVTATLEGIREGIALLQSGG